MMNQPTTPRPRRWRWFLIRFVGVIAALLFFVYLTRGFWLTTLRTYGIGRAYLASEEFGRFLPPVDEIEIMALGNEVPRGTPNSYSIDMERSLTVVNRQTVRGAEAEQIVSLWRHVHFDQRFAQMCHDPFYSLRFRYRGKLLLETSVCWECSTYMLPVGIFGRVECGFDAEAETAQKLLSTLTQDVPHPSASE